MAVSHLSRTFRWLEKEGMIYSKAECYISYGIGKGGIRRDLFGFLDAVALHGGNIIGVQSCGADFQPHVRKITEEEGVKDNAKLWLESGGKILLIGWRKLLKKRGGKLKVWTPRIKEFTLKDFE